jgi:hypothetical protein
MRPAMGSASTRSVTTMGLWLRRSISSRSASACWCAFAHLPSDLLRLAP